MKMDLLVYVFLYSWFFIKKTCDCDGSYTFENKIRFPYGPIQDPFMGIFLAISVPLELPHQSVFFSYNMEANYVLPSNQSSFTYPPLLTAERSFSRRAFYDMVEFKLKSHGYPSRYCLLRIICETSQYTLDNTGVLGDIFHILLTPSSSVNESSLKQYQEAEDYGKNRKNCKKYNKKCSISIMGLISSIGNFMGLNKM